MDSNNNGSGDDGGDRGKTTSLKIFRKFFTRRADGTLDASGILSIECYLAWMASRKGDIPRPERQFQRTISSHLTALDGRVPFSPEEEAAVLQVMRRKAIWPCFVGNEQQVGIRGFSAQGYHEKKKRLGQTPSPPTAAAAAAEPVWRSGTVRRENVDNEATTKKMSKQEEEDAMLVWSTIILSKPTLTPLSTTTTTEAAAPLFAPLDPFCMPSTPTKLASSTARQFSFDDYPFDSYFPMQQPQHPPCSPPAATAAITPVNMTNDDLAGYVDPLFLVQVLNHYSSMIDATPQERWKAVFEYVRVMMLPLTTKAMRGSQQDIGIWVSRVSASEPSDVAVFVCDPIVLEFKSRFVAQNEYSRLVLGDLVNNNTGMLFRIDDLVMLSFLFGATHLHMDREFPVALHLICKDGKLRLFNMRFSVEPVSCLSLLKAKLAVPW